MNTFNVDFDETDDRIGERLKRPPVLNTLHRDEEFITKRQFVWFGVVVVALIVGAFLVAAHFGPCANDSSGCTLTTNGFTQ